MQLDPIKLIDGIVKGTILALYDFAWLTLSALAFTFIRRSHKFWFVVLSITTRLSPLTYLFLWVMLAVGVYIQPRTLPGIFTKGVTSDTFVIVIMVCAFILTVSIDLLVRLGCSFISNLRRRRLYGSLLRIAAGALYFGAIIVLFLPRLGVPGFELSPNFGSMHFELGLFAVPLGIVISKAARAKRLITKAAIIVASILLIPYAVSISGSFVFFNTYFAVTRRTESQEPPIKSGPRLIGYALRCAASDNKVSLTGYIKLEGQDFLLLSPHDFHIWYTTQVPFLELDLGRPEDSSGAITLTAGTFTKVVLNAVPAISPADKLPESPFDCSLVVHRSSVWGTIDQSADIPFVDN